MTTLYACLRKNGDITMTDVATGCDSNETLLSWEVEGPQGPAGPSGLSGLELVSAGPVNVPPLTRGGNFAYAPAGKICIAGGHEITGYVAPTIVVVFRSRPILSDPAFSGWEVGVYNADPDNGIELNAWAICVDAPGL